MGTRLMAIGLAVLALTAAPLAAEEGQKPDLRTLASRVVENLAAGAWDEAVKTFDATMKEKMPAQTLAMIWKQLQTQCGTFKAKQRVSLSTHGEYTRVMVTCAFERLAIDITFVFNSKAEVGGMFFKPAKPAPYKAPAYANPETFTEKDVSVGADPWKLPGTLTLPKGEGPHPGVVLVHGSGPQDRDESLGPNKPFRDLAWGLATLGVAVLRYDKRTKVHAMKMIDARETLTVKEEVIDDACAAIALLAKTEGVDTKRVFVLAHSLGAMLAPRIAKRAEGLAGVVCLAGPGRPLEDLILDQYTYAFSLDGEIAANEKKQLDDLKAQIARVKDPALSTKVPSTDLPLGMPAAYWLSLRGYEPHKVAATVSLPFLVLQGERDYQVTMVDFGLWKAALKDKANATCKSYPALNHMFMAGKGRSVPAEYMQAGHVDPAVIKDVASFLKKP